MNQHDHMLREALRSFIEAMDGSCDHPDTSSEREALRHAKRKAKQALAAEPAPTVEPSEDAKRTLANPPERIYLQVGDWDAEFPGEIHWRDVTWCADQIERNDLVYVRSDLAEPAPLVRLTDEEVIAAWDGHIIPVFGKTGINVIVFAHAIMDAMERVNRRQLDQTPKTPSE